MTTPAGWFPDPEGAEGQRFWNGDEWTEHCAPDAPPAVDAARSSPRRAGKGLLVGLGAAVVLVLIVGAVIAVMLTKKADADGVTATPRQAETSAPSQMPAAEIGGEGPTEPQAAGTGEEVRDGDFAFVVNGVRTTDTIGDPEFPELNATAQGEYVIVALTVTNVSADPKTFFASFNTLSDGTTVFEPDDEAWLYLRHTVTDVGPGASRGAFVGGRGGHTVSSGLATETARMYPL